MTWAPMRGSKGSSNDSMLPAQKGRWLLLLGKPLLDEPKPRWVHFSWLNESFCIRDWTKGRELRQEPGLTASDVWRQAIERRPATGEYYRSINDAGFWTDALRKLDEETT